MSVKLKVTLGVVVSSLILAACGYCFPRLMLTIAAVYGILFCVIAVCFAGGMFRMGIRETSQNKKRKQPCG